MNTKNTTNKHNKHTISNKATITGHKKTALTNKKAKVIYVFQGGGALGAYQVGVFAALEKHGYTPNMLVGISIGAINAAIIAGNKPNNRLGRLQQFWDMITTKLLFPATTNSAFTKLHHMMSANSSLLFGQPGFFVPRPFNIFNLLNGPLEQLSFYDTSPLRNTLLKLIDFDYLNNESEIRLCVGSVELTSGEFEFFDSEQQTITVDHIMASGALPPGFPPVAIDGKYYIDGGVYSNTPISKVIDEFADSEHSISNVLCFMVDLFALSGSTPSSLEGLLERAKDIRYSSHAKRSNKLYATTQNMSHAIHYLGNLLTKEQKANPKVKELLKLGLAHHMDIIHLVYHSKNGIELESKDYEFSTESANAHYEIGYDHTITLIENQEKQWLKNHHEGVTIYTLEQQATTAKKVG